MLEEHLGYVVDSIRLEAFKAAISRCMRSGDRVLDLGCGSGILGLMCLQAGASRVVAIDSTAMIEVARETLTRAGLADRATFIRGHSTRVELPEPVDLVICDQVGHFGFDYGIVHALQDARRRFLEPGGRVIPRAIQLHMGAVESAMCRDKVSCWQAESVPREFHWLRRHTVNAKHAVKLPRDALLGASARIGEIALGSENPDYFRWTATLRIARDGMVDGLAGWFDCELADGISMTNSPLSDRAIGRSQAFLPIEESVTVRAGDEIRATVMARPNDNLIAWVVEFPTTGQEFHHSTWPGMPSQQTDLMRYQPDRVPCLSHEGRARVAVLGYCDGQRTVQDIQQEILRDHPDLFPSPEEIARFVAQVLGRDTE